MRYARLPSYLLTGLLLLAVVAAARPAPALTACAPDVRVATRVTGRERGEPVELLVTLTAAAPVPGGDRLTRVSFTSTNNATLNANGARVAVPATIPLDPPVTSWSFTVRKNVAGSSYLATFSATDLCGDVSKFVGAGTQAEPTAVAPTATATAPTQPSATPPSAQATATVTPAPATQTATSSPTASPTSTSAPGGAAYGVYLDGLASGWSGTPWSGTVNPAATSPVYSGDRSIAFSATGAWGGLSLHHGSSGLSTSPYTHLSFALRASQAGQGVGIALHGDDYQRLRDPIAVLGYGGDPPVGSWRVYQIPLADLGASGKVVKAFSVQDLTGRAQPPLYIDQVQLVALSGVQPPPTPVLTATPAATSAPTQTPTTVPSATPTQRAIGSGSASPVRLTTFYRPLSDGTTEVDLARVAGAAVLTRTDEAHRDRLRAAGFGGPVTQYLLAFETSGPQGLLSGGGACGWYQPYVNNMSGITGDFCAQLHGDERNFLHNGRGERLYATQSWQEGGTTKRAYLYLMNPAAPGWRAYAARRAAEEVRALGYDGIFLDNVDLSLYRAQRQEANSDGAVREFSTTAQFQDAVAGFLQAVKAEVGPAKLWANMTSGTDAPDDWTRYWPHLDGFMEEYFVARWGGTYPSPSVWETTLRHAEAASRDGKAFLAIGQGSKADTARMRFALASYLLVAGEGVTFRYADASGGESTSPGYYQLWRYPEYEARLGAPTGARSQAGTTSRREFACGYVTADPSSQASAIVVDTSRPGCS